MNTSLIEDWQTELREKSPDQILRWAQEQFSGSLTLATALGPEAQILTHFIARHKLDIPIFTLDTGRLFPETYELLAKTEAVYGLRIRVLFPDSAEVETMVGRYGPSLFRDSPTLRKHCCDVRKVNPLQRALKGKTAWISGLRLGQSHGRRNVRAVHWEPDHQMFKINPLWNWTHDRVWAFIREHHIPYNSLHDKGFPSIGCSSCTRAVQPGEDSRAGRWWWEHSEQKECGIHIVGNRIVRKQQSVMV